MSRIVQVTRDHTLSQSLHGLSILNSSSYDENTAQCKLIKSVSNSLRFDQGNTAKYLFLSVFNFKNANSAIFFGVTVLPLTIIDAGVTQTLVKPCPVGARMC